MRDVDGNANWDRVADHLCCGLLVRVPTTTHGFLDCHGNLDLG